MDSPFKLERVTSGPHADSNSGAVGALKPKKANPEWIRLSCLERITSGPHADSNSGAVGALKPKKANPEWIRLSCLERITSGPHADSNSGAVGALKPKKANPNGFAFQIGAGNEARTRDLDLGKVALYQLSYTRLNCQITI
jgi:hypothetical protein